MLHLRRAYVLKLIFMYFVQVFRLCRYHPGGHFAPHFDGHFVESSEVRSMKTLMIYLNGDFTGGSTNFVDEQQTLYKVKLLILCTVSFPNLYSNGF